MLDLEDFVAIDVKDFGEIPQENSDRSEEYSEFFGEAYHECFPDALAEEINNFTRFVAHPYRRCFDSPAKSPKNTEVESAIRNKGQKGCCTFQRENGGRFILRQLEEWMFYGDNLRRKHYYTSDDRVAMPYFDVDCHFDYQTQADAAAAREMIEKEFLARVGTTPHFVGSERGENGYLLVDLKRADPADANRIFDELQDAIRLLFAKHQIMADFEIKGTITWRDRDDTLHAGRYGKLPMSAPKWTYNWHRSLAKSKRVSPADLERFIASVKAEVTEADIARYEAARRKAFLGHYLPVGDKQRWKLNAEFGFSTIEDELVTYEGQKWIARSFVGKNLIAKLWPNYAAFVPADDRPSFLAAVPHVNKGAKPVPSKQAAQDVAALVEEPDSFKRQREALLRYARLLKRVPTVDEALKHIQDNGLYSGAWNNRARRVRVRGILKYIAKTFDRAKCSKPGSSTATVNLGKFDDWAKAKFPDGFVGGKRRNYVTEEFEVFEVQDHIEISWQFVSVFVSICEHCLFLDKNEDGSLPHARAKDLWNWLQNKGLVSVKFDDRKWAACRDGLEKLGIIKVTDRRYEAGKAMRWAVDIFFPMLGLWKTKKLPAVNEPVGLQEWLGSLVSKRDKQHNSLLRQQPAEVTDNGLVPGAQPPPGIESG